MRGLLIIVAVLIATVACEKEADCGNGCPPTTFNPTVRCPPCVNDRCSPDMCNNYSPIPFPNDCTKFCLCDSNGATEMNCPDGLVYYDKIKACDWPYNVGCSNSDPYPGCSGPPPPPPCNTTTKPFTYCPSCVNQWCTEPMCNEGVNVPYPGNCSKYCACSPTGAIEMNCPAGLIWNDSLKICDYPTDCSCPTEWKGC